MHPEDRVLVAVMNRPQDLAIARDQGWYRVPEKRATPGVFFEYVAFYLTAAFPEHKYAVQYYARRLGHELVTRGELLPEEPDHRRAGERYYKLQLGPLQKREPPIVSLRWRRVTFIHTTWDRFEAAEEINDLFVEGDEFVDRLYHALRETDLIPERCYPVREGDVEYVAPLAVPCHEGVVAVGVAGGEAGPSDALWSPPEAAMGDLEACVAAIRVEVARRGGIRPWPR
ncbi:MAG: hypothetical protein P8189_13210 [Anaerolineae bacterium]|jgi:hypothetical protein